MGSEWTKGKDSGSPSSTFMFTLLLQCFLSILDFPHEEPTAPEQFSSCRQVAGTPHLKGANRFVQPLHTAPQSSLSPVQDVKAVTPDGGSLLDNTIYPTQKMVTRHPRLKI